MPAEAPSAANLPRIHIGVGGWTYDAWRDNFYPKGLPQKQELAYASRQLTSIEINGTYYGSQKPASFARWHDETPDDFVFAVKGPRFTTNRRELANAGESVQRFLNSGVLELGDKLGPINWQFLPTKSFVADDFSAFLKLLPARFGGRSLRHAVEVRHASFNAPAFTATAREHGVAIVLAGDSEFPRIETAGPGFVYARIMGTTEAVPNGYADAALDQWGERLRGWRSAGLAVFCYVISGYKSRNPAAAMALMKRVS